MTDTPSRFTAPLQLVLMVAIIVATIIAGFVMMPDSQEERDALLSKLGTTNHGTLLQPALPIADLPLRDAEGNPWSWGEHKPKWRLLLPAGSACGEDCRELLYLSRQVHLLLGKYTGRFERFYVNLEGDLGADTAQYLEQEHHFVKVMSVDPAAFEGWIAGSNLPRGQGTMAAILVDPAGLAMMFYTADISGNHMLEDLNHLLKYSPD
ncbi:MAG: hypothetical protein WDA10_09135 [Porticoccaceae bacterium]|jgi:hypothetical protein|nr:hypothetical protein [Porticoccaceae bacterium]MEA3299150.1 hypothetical protein [Pseudomonadota bacterium]HLS98561.1 hypothetical protein [Porticoccaceae bacterium]